MFQFEKIRTVCSFDLGDLSIYHELTTDCLFVRYKEREYESGFGGLTQMLDPQTGKPLTYANWCEKYEKNVK